MAINILQELNLGAAKASFSRDEVETLADIKKLNIAQKYPNNYDIFCKEDGCKYRLNKTSHSTMQDNLPHPTGKWRRVDSVISSSMPAPITVGDVVLYLGPTVVDRTDPLNPVVKYQTGKYYRTEYAKVNKQMYAFVQNTAPDVPDTSPTPAVIWFSETSTLSEGSVLFTPVNGSIFDNKEHGIIMTSDWDGESAISGSSYEYLDNSNSAKLGMVRNSDFDTTFDSYPELTWNMFDTEAELENIKQNVIPEAISPVADDILALETKVTKSNKLADRFTDAEMDKLFKKVSEKIISSVNGVNDVDFRICACTSSDNWATATITKYMEAPLSGDLTDYHIALPGPYGNTFDTIAVSCGISFTNGTSATGMPAFEVTKKAIDTWLNASLLNPVAIYTAQTFSSSSFDKSTYYKTRVKDGGPYNATIKYSDMEPLKSNAYESSSRIHFLVFIQVDSNTTAEDLNAANLFELAKKAIVPVGSTSGMLTEFDSVKENASSAVTDIESLSATVDTRIPSKTSDFIKENIFEDKTPVHMIASYSESYHGPGTYDNTNNNGLISIGSTYDHTDANRSISPVFKNYFDPDSASADYVDASEVLAIKESEVWSNKASYIAIPVYIGSATTKALLAESLTGIIGSFNPSYNYKMTLNGRSVNTYGTLVDIYAGIGSSDKIDSIGNVKSWTRLTENSFSASELVTSLPDIVYGTYRRLTLVLVYNVYYGDYPVFDSADIIRIDSDTLIANTLNIAKNSLNERLSNIEKATGDVSDLIETVSGISASVTEATTKAARLDPLTDDIIHSITDKELSEANIVGGDLFDWTEVFNHSTPPESRYITQYVELRTVEELLDYNDTCIFNSIIEFEEADETLDDGSSYHTGIMTTSDYYLYPYSTEYLDALLTGQSFYENGIIDCSDSDGSDTVSALLRNSSLGNRCLDISTSIIFPNGQRWFPFNNKDEMLEYYINIELGSYTTNNNNFDIDEVWIGFSLYPSYEYISSMVSELSEAQWALMEIANNAYNVDGALGTKFIRLAVRDLIDDSKNSISLKLKDIPGLSKEIQNMFSAALAMGEEQGLDEEDLKDILDVRMSLMIPINTHIEEELTSFDILGLRDVSSEIIEHISINKESGNFIENTISELDTLSNKDKEFEKAFADLEPKLDGLTGDPSTEIIVGAATPSAAPSLDNRAISLGYDLKVQNLDGFPYIYMSGSKIAPYSEEDISELVNTSSIDSEFEGTLTFLGQITANNGTSVNYNVVDYSNILRSKITIDASKMPEGFVLKKVIFGLIPCAAMDAARYFTMLVEPKQDLSKGITTIEIKKTMLNSFINAMMEEMPSVIAQYALGVACFVDVGDKVEDASFLNDIDFSLFDQAITFITPGENRLNALPSLIEETKRTSKISDAGFELLNVIDESYNIANLSRFLAYKENYASLIRQTPIVPVTANRIIENDEMVSLEKDFNGLVYLGDNYFSDTDSLKPEFKNYMDSSYTSYTPLKNMLLELSGIPNRRYIGLFGYFNVVDDGLSSRDNFRTAASFAELMRTLKENGTYIDTSDYVMDDSSNEEKLRNGIAIPLGSDFSSVSSYCVSYNRTYITVLNCDSYSKYEPFYYYNNKKIGQDINKFKWILCKPTDSLYDLLSKNFSEDDFDTSYGSRCCLGIITVLDINSLDGSFSEDENAKMYQDLAAMDFSSQMPKLCYAAFNKIADFDVAASNTKNIKESVGNIDYKEFNATPIAFATQSVDSESGSDPVNYDAIIYPRLVLPPELDSATNTYTVRFHGTTEEENNLTVNDLVTNGDVFMFFSFFGDNLLHVNFGGDYSHGDTKLSNLDKLNRTGGIVWYNTRYMKDSSIDFSQHGDYDASELFVNIDPSQIRELYAAVIPNDSPSNSIQQYFTSKYNSSTGKLLETMSDIPGFVRVPLDYHEEDLTGTKRTVSLETIIDLCGRPIYSGNINPKGGYILFVAKLNETKAGVTKYLNDYTYYHYPISSFCPFNNYEDNFGYYSAYDFGWCDIFPNSQHMMDNPPCYITRSLDNSIKQAKNVALKAAKDAAADKTKVPTFYTSYSNLKNDIQKGEMGYLVKVDPNNSSNYLADVYVKTLDGTIIKMSENVECEPSQSIINALNG